MFKKISSDESSNDHDYLNYLINSYQTIIEQYINNQSNGLEINNLNNSPRRATRNYSYILIRSLGKTLRWSTRLSIGLFTCIGLLFTSVYIGMRFGMFNVQGSISQRDSFYGNLTKVAPLPSTTAAIDTSSFTTAALGCNQSSSNCAWINSPEWVTVSAGLIKDSEVINEAATQTGVSARMIASSIAPEQLRLFTSEREVYESYFQPLKILGSMTDFSLGVAGIKQQTASQIEANADNVSSAFYPGPGYSNLITYPVGSSQSTVQYNRLTSTDHYYDYLYVGLFIKELDAQWLKAGYDISQRPDVITTLYNIGMSHSIPKPNPEAGGATITVNNQSYSYGELGTLIFNSNQLISVFPQPTEMN
jgi:hypothetical protein